MNTEQFPHSAVVAEIQLSYRPLIKPSQRPKVCKSAEVEQVFRDNWDLDRIELQEQFKVMLLNRANRVLGIVEISSGGMAGTVADPKLIFAAALRAGASSIILSHNHPSCNLKPSDADIALTTKIIQAGQFLDIAVLDHIILTAEGYFSFPDEGLHQPFIWSLQAINSIIYKQLKFKIMETKNQGKTENTGSKVQPVSTAQRPSIPNPAKDNKAEAGKAESKPETEVKKAEVAPPVKVQEKAKSEAGTPKEDQKSTEVKPDKPALNLEGTLKLVEELHRRKIQRDRLLETIDTLEAFEIAQKEDAEETDSNHFQGCTLTIQDDDNRKFITKNPVIIFSVAQYVNSMCVNRLAEIEAGIIIPA